MFGLKMRVAFTVLLRVWSYYGRLRCKAYRWRFVMVGRARHSSFEIGNNVGFNVPVRAGGSGCIRIGARNTFGESKGYRLGSGEISLYTDVPRAEIVIGERNFFNNNVSIGAVEKVVIGNDCLIGGSVSIADCDFHDISPEIRHTSQGSKKPVQIGNNVWLGTGVAVLKGVTIGDNSVVGAMSVVTKPIPANCVAAGNPARIIRIFKESKARLCNTL
jgi:acetyltransferase-like isoleucine patch superfamily enzyme